MKSTGEVLGVGYTVEEALFKGFVGAGTYFKKKTKKVLVTINNNDKEAFMEIAKKLSELGYMFIATEGTANKLKSTGITVEKVTNKNSLHENILDIIKNENLDFIVNTPTIGNDSTREGFKIRRLAVENNIQLITSLDMLNNIISIQNKNIKAKDLNVKSL